jgi:heat-inducible transcriptional repressor
VLDERKTAILRAVVQEYISTAQPVGSTHVAASSGLNVSSATVRNEMAVLEQEGYLAQPHTSAGRIPTDKGYRFFVDHLAKPGVLDVTDSQRVGTFFDSAHGRLEELLHQTSNLLSSLTHHAAVVVGPSVERATVRSVQIVGLSSHVATVVAVLSNGTVDSQTFEMPAGTSELRLQSAGSVLQSALTGHTIDHTVDFSHADPSDAELCKAALGAMQRERDDEPVYVGGAASMASSFDAVDTVRGVLRALEQQYVVVGLVRDVLQRGLSVAIGAEHGVEPLAACSVVISPVVVEGEQMGTVGVLGPTRMNYPQAMATVGVVSEHLGRRLGDTA